MVVGIPQLVVYLEVTKSNDITNKYSVIVCKYTVTVNAGNFQSGNIVVSNDKDKAVATAIVFYLCKERGDKVANGTKV